MTINLRHLQTLIAVHDHRTFIAAGQAIGLTQSAISLHIKALESELGVTLFDRRSRPPLLNEKGLTLVSEARKLITMCDTISRTVAGQELSGRLTVGAVPTTLSSILPHALQRLREYHPQLHFYIRNGGFCRISYPGTQR